MKCSRAGRICSRSLAGSTDLNEQQLDAGNQQVVSLLLSFQTRLLLTLVAALALGLGLALFTMRKILKLEDQARLQYVEVAEARSQLKELSARLVQAQENERRSLSRELHDEVGQALSAVLVELRNLSAGLAVRSEEQSRRHVETIKGLVESTVRVVRNMALLLRPSMLDDLGLIPALKWQARESSKSTSMDVTVDVASARNSIPMSCRTSTRLASIAWSRKRCTTARGIPTPPPSVFAWNRSAIACC